ncbi:MAG: hypothetical protein GY780_17815 [bacterium]|nr:hypothetical protein [bacterium]
MNLNQAIQSALDQTGRLEAALSLGELELCKDLLVLRGETMMVFQQMHQISTQEEKLQCQDLLIELKKSDQVLMTNFNAQLENSAVELRKANTSGSGTPVGSYKNQAAPSCVDRKA